jgi:hypothetical protein
VRCYVCLDRSGRLVEAVAVCRFCMVGLCAEHLREEEGIPGPAGVKSHCGHRPGRRRPGPAPS